METNERLAKVEEKLGGLEKIIKELKDMINPKAELWNNAVIDVKWLKKFFWVIFASMCTSTLSLIAAIVAIFLFG